MQETSHGSKIQISHSSTGERASQICACVYGWEQYKDSCYFFNTEPSDVMVGYDSWKMCQKVGANLVIIDDEDEDVFYRSRIPETDTLWIGLYSQYHASFSH
ncbi:hypothetical protein SK128_003944 [Halocaridina rubra]|uniref:C-type lectin domain-containing protein n=1 Tax=Halocaridina rubra TaxID=373956 RepID=A0AAN9A977_HALRR